jgi:hypothetical protein
MFEIESLPIVLTGIGIIVSILYYTSVLRSADRTRKTQLLMDVKRQLDDPDFWRIYRNVVEEYEWSDYDDFEEKYGFKNNPDASSEITSLLAFFNGIGVLVATDRIDVDFLGMHLGYLPMEFWSKMEPIILEERKRRSWPYMYVYLEFLKDAHLKRVTRPRGKASYLEKQ